MDRPSVVVMSFNATEIEDGEITQRLNERILEKAAFGDRLKEVTVVSSIVPSGDAWLWYTLIFEPMKESSK